MDCGPACLGMIAAHYGKRFSISHLREICFISRDGVSVLGISEAAEELGFRTLAVQIPYDVSNDDPSEASLQEVPLPCIVHWQQYHFVVVYKVTKTKVWIADPGKGKIVLDRKSFEKSWLSHNGNGIALLLETTPDFYLQEGSKTKKTGFGFLFSYIRPYRGLIGQLAIGLFLGSIFQLLFPFLTQAVVDIGIENQNLNFIYLILIAQLMLFLGQITVNVIQNWILLHIGTRVNIALISDFLLKMMKLPIAFFDVKMIGDLLQRIGDHRRIEAFLTGTTLKVIFSVFNLILFGLVLWIYHFGVFVIFLLSAIVYVLWVMLFLKKRRTIDYQKFQELSANQQALIELIQGMQEIKLQQSELKRRWQWTNIQARLFRANLRSLAITQYQDAGAGFISNLKDILISFVAARAVIYGEITLGMMLAIQYIVGQLNAPLLQLITFIREAQDAKISLERLGEIHKEENEEQEGQLLELPETPSDLKISDLSFQYNQLEEEVLKNINLIIPKGKVTAIVGTSGSGKTTLVKLLLGFYEPSKGKIQVGNISLSRVSKNTWRKHCGAVMQDGFIFSDTIARNIAESEDQVNKTKLLKAVQVANIQEFIESMPLGYNTLIGAKGNGISQGQRQRLLIARAVYRNPDFLFFDEATNALDAKNERVIVENLADFFERKTVIVVAHRLSTVKNADNIIVLEKGYLVEQGSHDALVEKKGAYYRLIKNQLELGG